MKILAASDLTARSDRALARAFLLAREHEAELRIAHVVDAELPVAFRTHAVEWAAKMLSGESEKLGAATGVKAAIDVRTGKVGADIARMSNAPDTDLIALGAQDQPPADRRSFSDTTAGRILRSSRAATLLVRNEAV